MRLVYAYGSGLGHLKRVSDFLRQKNIPAEECFILTQSENFGFWGENWNVVHLKRETFANAELFKSKFQQICSDYNIQEIIVDVFLEGFFGELTDCFNNCGAKKILLSRILSQTYFEKFSAQTVFDEVYFLEKGIVKERFLFKNCYETDLNFYFKKENKIQIPQQPYYLVIHSQPLEEVIHLIKTAEMYNPDVPVHVLTTTKLPESILEKYSVIFSEQPSLELLNNAEKIFSGTGFNAVRMLVDYRLKTKFVPFPRIYDDQFLRKIIIEENNGYI